MGPRWIILITVLCCTVSAWAQPEEYSKARRALTDYKRDQKPDDLRSARAHIDRAAKHDSTAKLAKVWYFRGQIYLDLYKHEFENKKIIFNGLDLASETKAALVECNDTFLVVAGQSLIECVRLDTAGQYADQTGNLIREIASWNQAIGVAQYGSGKFWEAAACFFRSFVLEQRIGIYDSLALFNAALSALKAERLTNAIAWSGDLVAKEYHLELSRWILSQSYLELGVYDSAYSSIRASLAVFPGSQALQVQFVEYSLLVNDTTSADSMVMKMGKIPQLTTATDFGAMGEYYQFLAFNAGQSGMDNGGRIAEKQLIGRAEFCYTGALRMDPAMFDARYNLGTLYYNAGLREKERRPDLEAVWKNLFRKAAAEFEQALLIRSKDVAVLNALKTIYSSLGDTENYNRIRGLE